MAVLTDTQRRELWADLQRQAGAVPGSLTKPDIRAAVDAVDAWCDANSASFNTAIPQPARTALSAQQKAALLVAVTRKRFEVS